jgi:hypothetical protein
MTGRWPFKKTQDINSSSSSAAKKKAASPHKKERNRPYMNVEIAQSCTTKTCWWACATSSFPAGGCPSNASLWADASG